MKEESWLKFIKLKTNEDTKILKNITLIIIWIHMFMLEKKVTFYLNDY